MRRRAAGLKERDFGRLCMLMDCEVALILLPPEEAQPALVPMPSSAPADLVTH
jgi:hypothetical protein